MSTFILICKIYKIKKSAKRTVSLATNGLATSNYEGYSVGNRVHSKVLCELLQKFSRTVLYPIEACLLSVAARKKASDRKKDKFKFFLNCVANYHSNGNDVMN